MPTGKTLEINKDILFNLYITKNLSIRDIAKILNTSYEPIRRRVFIYGLIKPLATITETKLNNIKRTMRLKYGADCYMSSGIGYTQYQKALEKTYGITNIMQLDSTKVSRAKTCLRKYGVDHSLKSESIRQKAAKTCLKKYGVDNPFKSRDLMANSLSKRENFTSYMGNGEYVETRFGKIYVRSGFESKFLKLIASCELLTTLKYESFSIFVKNINKTNSYTPDFLLNGNIIIELKPRRFIYPPQSDKNNTFVQPIAKTNRKKHRALKKWAKENGYKYFLITESRCTKTWCHKILLGV